MRIGGAVKESRRPTFPGIIARIHEEFLFSDAFLHWMRPKGTAPIDRL